ncbi:MAG: 50S ribosomal protein L22 [Candidatus Pacebacteria bacterium]|nr:50S ribosomal protein L22 [Candidatus Paceibacterota bacterium]
MFQVKLSHLHISPRKARLVADLVRGKGAEEAQTILNFTIKKSADPMLKLLNSAIANAKTTKNIEAKDLYISKVLVNEGPIGKRLFPRAKGRGDIIKKRTSHIVLVLDARKEEVKKETKKKDKKVVDKKK